MANESVVKVSADTSNYNKNIDDAAQSTKKFQDAADDANKTIKDLGDKGAKSAKDLLKEMQNLEKGGRSVSNYRRKLAGLQRDIADLTVNYRAMSKEMQNSDLGREAVLKINELTKEAAGYKDAILDAQAAIKNMASDTASIDALKGGIDLISGGMQAFASAGILGAESTEELVKVIAKLQAIEKGFNGVQKVMTALQKESALMQGIQRIQTIALTKAKQAETTAVGAATVAQKLFNKVAMANPYVLLAAAIIAVVGAVVALTKANDKAKKAQEELTAAHEAYMDSMQDSISKMGEAAGTFDTLTRKYRDCRTEAEKQQFLTDYKGKLDDLGLSINDINGLEEVFVRRTEAFRQACIIRAQAMGLETIQNQRAKEEMEDLMKAQDLAAGRNGQRVNEGDPLFDLLKKYNVGTLVQRWGKDYINATDDVYGDLQKAIKNHYKGIYKQIENENDKLADEFKNLDLGDYATFDGKGNSGANTPDANGAKDNSKANKQREKEYKSQLEQLKKQLQVLEEQKKDIIEGTQAWEEQLQKINEVQNKIKQLEDAEKAYIEALNRQPRVEIDLPKIDNLKLPDKVEGPEIKLTPVLQEDKMRELLNSAEEAAKKVNERFKLGLIDEQTARQMIDNINTALKAANIRAEVTLDVNIPEVKDKAVESLKNAAESISRYGSVADGIVGNFGDIYENLSTLGERLEEIDDPLKQFFTIWQAGMQVLQSVTGVIEAIAAVTEILNAARAGGIGTIMSETAALKQNTQEKAKNAGVTAADAIASGAKSVADIPVVGWVMAIAAAAGLAAILISAMKNAKKFAGGGIVGGNSFHGDKIMAGVNSGEMILNKDQQNKLFKMINEGGVGNGQAGQVEFKIRGTDLVGTLKNYSNKQAKL